jgi:hypothetical protein
MGSDLRGKNNALNQQTEELDFFYSTVSCLLWDPYYCKNKQNPPHEKAMSYCSPSDF